MKAYFALLMAFCLCATPSLADDEKSELHKIMEKMEESFNSVSNALRAGDLKPSHIQDAENIQSTSVQSALLTPSTALSDGDRLEYQTAMIELMEQALILETEIEKVIAVDGAQDKSEVIKVWKKMNKMRKSGHNDWQEPE